MAVNLPFFGTVHYNFYRYQDENLKLDSQQYRAGYAGWPGSILVANANHFRSQQDKS